MWSVSDHLSCSQMLMFKGAPCDHDVKTGCFYLSPFPYAWFWDIMFYLVNLGWVPKYTYFFYICCVVVPLITLGYIGILIWIFTNWPVVCRVCNMRVPTCPSPPASLRSFIANATSVPAISTPQSGSWANQRWISRLFSEVSWNGATPNFLPFIEGSMILKAFISIYCGVPPFWATPVEQFRRPSWMKSVDNRAMQDV